MRQPIKKSNKNKVKITTIKNREPNSHHQQEYGTSKLEEYFAKEFLEKLGIEYVYQFKAESIGRFFDFFIPKERLIIEVDGDYW